MAPKTLDKLQEEQPSTTEESAEESTEESAVELAEALLTKNMLKSALRCLWEGIGFFGLTLIPIGLYYLFFLIFGNQNPKWCKPLEEFEFPSNDALRMIWAVGVIAGMLLFLGAIFAIIVFINILVTCFHITNWFLNPTAWGTCTDVLVGTVKAVVGGQ